MENLDIYVTQNTLTAQLYASMHALVDFKAYALEDIQIALSNDLVDFVVMTGHTPIGIARIVGDDRIVFFIKDVIVHPDYQQCGVGDCLMQHMLAYIQDHACTDAYIGLMATKGKEPFYERYGFVQRPNDRFGSGMVKFYET